MSRIPIIPDLNVVSYMYYFNPPNIINKLANLLKIKSLYQESSQKETLGVHQKNWVCHIYCQINVQKN